MTKNILFICRHNVFRSKTAEMFFNKYNKNKKYNGSSAGVFQWDKPSLRNDSGFQVELKAYKDLGLKLKRNPRAINHKLLDEADIVVIVANDIDKTIFTHEPHFHGKVIVWKIKDVLPKTSNKYKRAVSSIREIEKRIKKFVKVLK